MHWSLFSTPISIFLLLTSKGNNLVYIYCGGAFCVITSFLILMWYRKHVDTGHFVLNLILAFAGIVAIMNLNQWEIYDLYCNAFFMLRILAFLTAFILADKFFRQSKNSNSKSILSKFFIGVFCMLVLIGFGGAYSAGYLAAIVIVAILNTLLSDKSRKTIIFVIIFSALLTIGIVIYYLTLPSSSIAAPSSLLSWTNYIEGFFIMLGATVIPIAMAENGFTSYIVLGSVIFLFAIESIIVFFRMKLYKESWLPFELLVYAGVSALVITYGRTNSHGIGMLPSSRYMVETTLGLLGIIMVHAMVIKNAKKSGDQRTRVWRGILLMIPTICIAGLVPCNI